MVSSGKKRPKDRWEAARLLLKKARKQAKIAEGGVNDEEDDIAVTFLFQAYENAVRAAAKSTGQFADTDKHWDLSAQADDLANEGYLGSNVSERLDELNEGRKTAAYGYEEEFNHRDFKEMLEELESYFQEVDELIQRQGKKLSGAHEEKRDD